MVQRNPNITKLQGNYLFPEIARRRDDFLKRCPHAEIISLGIGDTTEPIPSYIVNQLKEAVAKLATRKGYRGYGPEQGLFQLRERIAKVFYRDLIHPDEIFVSDGAKCDIGRLQTFFGSSMKVAVQDPSYPVYVDGSVIAGSAQGYDIHQSQYKNIYYMPCNPENNFFPDLSCVPACDLIYFCSPNNPTGSVATHAQLKELVQFAKKNHSFIVFDSAYRSYIQEKDLPRSIYEIEGAKEVAIEIGSFSKFVGFTGVRLGWSVIPKTLYFEDQSSVYKDWIRYISTIFNGASNISQLGGIACLEKEGHESLKKLIDHYIGNARLLKKTLDTTGFQTYSKVNAPFIWAYLGEKDSWDYFEEILQKTHIITTPGSGFGNAGKGFIRFSAFGSRSNIEQACQRLEKAFKT